MSSAANESDGGFQRQHVSVVHEWAMWSLVTGTFADPGGEVFSRTYVRSPGAVGVIAVYEGSDPKVILVRQYRPALNRMTLELPAGMRDLEGEDTLLTAQRELREEVGVVASYWQRIGRHVSSPGISNSSVELFLARGLCGVEHDRHGPEERHMTIEEYRLSDAMALVFDGRIDDGKTVIGILAVDRMLRQG